MNFQKLNLSIGATSRPIDCLDIEQANRYFSEHPHPLSAYYLRTGDGSTHKISDFLNETQLHHSEGLYHKYLQLLGQEDEMGFMLPTSQVATSAGNVLEDQEADITISLLRPERSFSERDRLVLNLLRPHLLQAYLNAQALTQMQQELAQLNQTVEQLGTITLNSDGKVQLMTQKAWTFLRQYFHIQPYANNSIPEHLQRWINHQIALQTQEEDILPCCPPLQLEREGKRLSIRLIANQSRKQYLLLLEECQITPLTAASLELLGLTRREAEVLFWVTQDKSDMEIASKLGLRLGTIKKHLEHTYQKLGVHTRTSAVMYALRALGRLN